jgi:hypothetical protein
LLKQKKCKGSKRGGGVGRWRRKGERETEDEGEERGELKEKQKEGMKDGREDEELRDGREKRGRSGMRRREEEETGDRY